MIELVVGCDVSRSLRVLRVPVCPGNMGGTAEFSSLVE